MMESYPSEQAARCVAEGLRLHASGALSDAITSLRRAVLLYAADDEAQTGPERTPQERCAYRRARADACQRYADCLTEAGEHPEAANIYQEAADLYALVGDEAAQQQARVCAQKILAGVAQLRSRPHDRLYLLIAHYERRQRQLALSAGTEQAQAECARHIARVFHRRERPQEALERYQEALALYARVPQTEEVGLACAECHHRMANLLHYYLDALEAAAQSYREAIALYAAYGLPTYSGDRMICLRAVQEIERHLDAARCAPETREE
ncbi:MAG TPA: hypothetical protein VFB38_11325 [Chthonomonadaceae bacterium]|nr:hypothetical protein [Chthonomonadaceae bacterium]